MQTPRNPSVKLTLAYSTLFERAGNIQLPPPRTDFEVVILVQSADGSLPANLPQRADVRAIGHPGRGVARSRNAAIDNAAGEYVVFADDDIVFDLAGIDKVLAHLDSCGCALIIGEAIDETGKLRKPYPAEIRPLTRFNSAKAATYEMVLRVAAAREQRLRFDERFGAGAVNFLGDEYIFIADLLRAGFRAHFLPVVMATHPSESSGSRWGSPADLRARSLIFNRVFGSWAPLVRIGFGLRHWRRLGSARNVLRFVVGFKLTEDRG